MKHISVRRVMLLVLAFVASAFFQSANAQQLQGKPRPPGPIRVLFIGNSATFANNLPELLEGLRPASQAEPIIHAEMVAIPNLTLQEHWLQGKALLRIREKTWDYVVVQDMSTLGLAFVDGRWVINDPQLFFIYARLFDREIRDAGAKTVFLLPNTRKANPEQLPAVTAAYDQIARELGAKLVPWGPAAQQVRQADPELQLFAPDAGHPSSASSYLAANLLYLALVGDGPVVLPGTVSGHNIPFNTAGAPQSTISKIVDLSATDAAELQGVAARVHREFAVLPRPAIVAPEVPRVTTLPTGQPLAPTDLLGVWRGTLKLYPAPAEIELRVTNTAGKWAANWHVASPAAGLETTIGLETFTLNGNILVFVVPSLEMGATIFRGVFNGTSLVGTAESGDALHVPHLMGSWELKRVP